MTDKEKFIALMTKFGVPLMATGREATETMSIQAMSAPKVAGFSGFSADFKFDAYTGAFVSVSIWK